MSDHVKLVLDHLGLLVYLGLESIGGLLGHIVDLLVREGHLCAVRVVHSGVRLHLRRHHRLRVVVPGVRVHTASHDWLLDVGLGLFLHVSAS